MTVTAYARGREVKHVDNRWVYEDTGEPYDNPELHHSKGNPLIYRAGEWFYEDGRPFDRLRPEKPCARCGRYPTPEGYDACLGHIEGAVSACCGHGAYEGYVIMEGDGEL